MKVAFFFFLSIHFGAFLAFKFLLSSAFRDARSFSFFQERFVHQNGELRTLASILKDSGNYLPKNLSQRNYGSTEQLRNMNPGDIIQFCNTWEHLLRFAVLLHRLTQNFTKRNIDLVLDYLSAEFPQIKYTQNITLPNADLPILELANSF